MNKQKNCRFSKGKKARGKGFILVLIALALLAGCTLRRVYTGSPLPGELDQILLPGMTKSQVLEILGPPDSMGLRLQGSIFIYRYSNRSDEDLKLSLFQASFNYDSSDLRTDRLVVFFDKKGRVTAFGKN